MSITRVTKPIRRLVNGQRLGELVVEIHAGVLVVRPYRARSPLFEATYTELTTAVLIQRAPKRVKRGRV